MSIPNSPNCKVCEGNGFVEVNACFCGWPCNCDTRTEACIECEDVTLEDMWAALEEDEYLTKREAERERPN